MNELPIEKPTLEMLSYESHIDSILSANHLDKTNYYLSMVDMEVILLENSTHTFYDFFMGRTISQVPLSRKFISRKDIRTEDELVIYLEKELKKEKYIYLSIDTFFVESYSTAGNKHIVHSPLVAGIDKDKNILKICDFFDYTHYSFQWVNLKNFVQAYYYLDKFLWEIKIKEREKWLYCIEEIEPTKKFTKVDNSKILTNYLKGNSTNFLRKDAYYFINQRLANEVSDVIYQIKIVHGIQIYEYLKERIKYSLKMNEKFDKKSITLLYKHFKVYKYLMNELDLDKEWIYDCEEKSKKVMFLGLKEMLSNKFSNYSAMLNLIEDLKVTEERYLNERLFK
ncbi:MAG: hypothetical protein LBI13_04240 [Streptococcaceae bacterium]|jgi:hypothetical protein|nr:hypothetical protein [Streptococcaceae bacterium]